MGDMRGGSGEEARPGAVTLPERMLLCRPASGLNDLLVQIDRCRLYTARHGRALIVDTGRSGLRDDFHAYFEAREGFGPALLPYGPELEAALNRVRGTRPAEVEGRIGRYDSAARGRHVWLEGGAVALDFDMRQDHPEQLLLCESFGGGQASLRLLRHLVLQADVAEAVLRRVLALGPGYDAIHVRHSDYRTEYARFLARIAPALRGRRVLLCTDSREVQEAAPGLLGDVELLTLGAVPDTGGQPLHERTWGDQRGQNIALLADLLALAGARRMWFTRVGRRQVSGFSTLAEGLRRLPGVQRGLVERAHPALREAFDVQLGARDRAERGSLKDRVGAWCVEAAEAVWNRDARRSARRMRRFVAREM